MMHSVALLGAGVCEVLGVVFLNKTAKSSGIKRVINFSFIVVTFGLSLLLLRYAMQALPMSVSYAVWTGIGAIGAVLVGYFFNGEKMSVQKGVYLFLIVFSAIMLKII